MASAVRDLKIYLDVQPDASGRQVLAIVATDDAGQELVARKESTPSRLSSREALLAAFFAVLEEAVLLEGARLEVHLSGRYEGVELGVNGSVTSADLSTPKERTLQTRIHELAGAFEAVVTSCGGAGEENRATALLARVRA